MSTVVVLLIKHILFFYILVTITLMNPKVPNETKQEEVMSFDVLT